MARVCLSVCEDSSGSASVAVDTDPKGVCDSVVLPYWHKPDEASIHDMLQAAVARVEGSFANVEASIAQSRAALAQLEKKLGAPVEALTPESGANREAKEAVPTAADLLPPDSLPGTSGLAAMQPLKPVEPLPALARSDTSVSGDLAAPTTPTLTVLGKSRQPTSPTSIRKQIKKRGSERFGPSAKSRVRELSTRIVTSWAFELYILAAIVLNSVIIGIESELSINDEKLEWATTVEAFLLVVYTVELILRFLAAGRRICCEGWFCFDLGLVFFSYAERIFASVAGEESPQIMLLRLMRLFRLIRAFRMIKKIRPLSRLVHGLLASSDTIASAFLLLFLMLYVFGVVGLELIATNSDFKNDPEANFVIQTHFSSLGMSMITVSQFITMDNISQIYAPLIAIQPLVFIYFGALIAVISISVMNLVTASLVEASLEHAKTLRKEDEMLRNANMKEMLPELEAVFDLADADGSGEIAIEEMREFERRAHVPDHFLDHASVGSMTELFSVLDVDKSGVVTREEFIDGLLEIMLQDVSLSSLQQLKMLRLMKESIAELDSKLTRLGGMAMQSDTL